MKKYFLPILMILLLPIYINAQNIDFCGYDPTETRFVEIPYADIDQNVTRQSFHDNQPLVLKVHFWDINLDDGSNPHPLTEQQVLNEIAKLNKNYNDFNIFLKYDGISSFNSDDYFDFNIPDDVSPFHDFLYYNNYYFEGYVNIYSVDVIDQGIIAFYSVGSNYINFDIIVSNYNAIDDDVYPHIITHEVGHKFHLQHTFHCGMQGLSCEHVIRDPEHDDYNADIHGDYIIDTKATPKWYSYDPETCEYTDNLMDETGLPYDYNGLSPEVTNFMSYQYDCASEFTNGQGAVMRWYIKFMDDHPNDITVINTYSPEILYEPFEGEYGLCNGNEAHNPKFQYGFDYEFIECRLYDMNSQNCPTNYGDHNFILGADAYDKFDSSENYNSSYGSPIVHPNHTAIIINQLTNNSAEKCYDAWRNASSGSIKNFLDGVVNYNYTIQYLDSLQVNNPDLIPNLQNGLYNIDKQYNDGQNTDKTILKTNNP